VNSGEAGLSPVQGTKEQIQRAILSFGDRYTEARRQSDPSGLVRARALQNAQEYVRQHRPDIPPGLLRYVRTDALQSGSFLRMGQGREERMERFEGAVNRAMSNMQSQIGRFEGWLAQKEQQQREMFGGRTGSEIWKARRASAPPEPPSQREAENAANGKFISSDGKPVDSAAQATPFLPQDQSKAIEGEVLFVNGREALLDQHRSEAQALADKGLAVTGLYAAPDADSGQVVQGIKSWILDRFDKGKDVHLTAHSQGADNVARGLKEAYPELVHRYGQSSADQMFRSIKVETFGGVMSEFELGGHVGWRESMPNGPQYVHYVGERDLASKWLGWSVGEPAWRRAGEGAAFVYLPEGKHDLTPYYLLHRMPFDVAREVGITKEEWR
jgi:hypothetical protein